MVSQDAGRQSKPTERGRKMEGIGAACTITNAKPRTLVATIKFRVMAAIKRNGIREKGTADGQKRRKLRSRHRVDGEVECETKWHRLIYRLQGNRPSFTSLKLSFILSMSTSWFL